MLPSFEGEHLEQALGTYLPQGQVPRFPHEYLVHPDTPTMIGWTGNQVLGRSLIRVLFRP